MLVRGHDYDATLALGLELLVQRTHGGVGLLDLGDQAVVLFTLGAEAEELISGNQSRCRTTGMSPPRR